MVLSMRQRLMLPLADGDNYYRGRRDCEEVRVDENFIFSRWSPWHDVHVDTWLIPFGEWHLRLHRINSARTLQTAEGGFAVRNRAALIKSLMRPGADNAMSFRSPDIRTGHPSPCGKYCHPPNSSVMFPECAAIPLLTGEIAHGESWLLLRRVCQRSACQPREPP